jgi:hypothetical protein
MDELVLINRSYLDALIRDREELERISKYVSADLIRQQEAKEWPYLAKGITDSRYVLTEMRDGRPTIVGIVLPANSSKSQESNSMHGLRSLLPLNKH